MDDMTKEEMKDELEELGISYGSQWNKAELFQALLAARSALEEEEEEEEEPIVPQKPKPVNLIKNISNRPWVVFDRTLMPGDAYDPTKEDMENKRAIAKIKRAISMGQLKRG